jgi:hypothetical protein
MSTLSDDDDNIDQTPKRYKPETKAAAGWKVKQTGWKSKYRPAENLDVLKANLEKAVKPVVLSTLVY